MLRAMAEHAPYAPGPGRIARARARGEVPRSPVLTVGTGLLAVLGLGWSGLAPGAQAVVSRFGQLFEVSVQAACAGAAPLPLLRRAALDCLWCSGPWLVAFAGGVILGGALQTGFGFWGQLGLPRWSRLSPHGLQARLSPGRLLSEVAQRLLQGAFILGLAALLLWPALRGVVALPAGPWPRLLPAAEAVSGALLWRVCLGLLALGALDFLLRRARHFRELRMTRAEAEQERRLEEGPQLPRARRRALWRGLG